ncbi:MAG: hypothetical protein Q8L59_05635 [Phenylobacterium sp.]|uniref:hypothetical protein n=1 Tax=Phenylobacterium sp. TaxID=1871053 RepID=UPI0027323051|nr:hypothetical protein [Phenylobacterium sp.]MDP1641647.1 hypothetical protein [Phenylobacterium sp.]MDP3116293.1 hypothetical protein [Phenylobacterium sp.]
MAAGTIYILTWVLLWTLLLTVCAFAFRRGGPAERLGAGLILTLTVVTAAGDLFAYSNGLRQHEAFLVGRMLLEGALALGFLALAIRFTSLWLGGAMLFQAVQFSLQAAYFVLERAHDAIYVVINNIDFLGILACLTAGTLAASRRRRRAEAEVDLTPPAVT